MKYHLLFCLLSFFMACETVAQDGNTMENPTTTPLPYYEIPEAPEAYTACAVAARIVDGLGFRYYWATEGLREEDLNYRPNESARTAEATLEHIYGLSRTIVNAVKKVPNERRSEPKLSFEEMRRVTLENFKTTSDILRVSASEDMANFQIIFKRGNSTNELPFWNLLNGHIADALWHTGQVVSFRRSSGNPFNSKASVLSGKVRE